MFLSFCLLNFLIKNLINKNNNIMICLFLQIYILQIILFFDFAKNEYKVKKKIKTKTF